MQFEKEVGKNQELESFKLEILMLESFFSSWQKQIEGWKFSIQYIVIKKFPTSFFPMSFGTFQLLDFSNCPFKLHVSRTQVKGNTLFRSDIDGNDEITTVLITLTDGAARDQRNRKQDMIDTLKRRTDIMVAVGVGHKSKF